MTNPPYNISTKFAKHAILLSKKVCGQVFFLCRLAWLEGKERGAMFKSSPLRCVYVFSGRIPRMHRPEYVGYKVGSMMPFAWFHWDWNHIGPPTLAWI